MKIPRGQTPERAAYMKAWNAANPRDRSKYKAAYDARNRERHAQKHIECREKRRAAAKADYKRNRAQYIERAKRRLMEKREAVLAYQASYYRNNSDYVKNRNRAYQKANPEIKAQCSNRRRVRKADNGGSHTIEERVEKFRQLGNVCFYCGEAKPLTIDHDVPLVRGGGDDISNILPACRSCNSRKNAKTALEFLATMRSKLEPSDSIR